MEPIGHYLLLIAIVGMPLGVVVLYLKTIRGEMLHFHGLIGRRIDDHEVRLRVVEEEKIDKNDWLRAEFATRQKVDKVSEKITALQARIESEFGMAAAVNRLADEITKGVGQRS